MELILLASLLFNNPNVKGGGAPIVFSFHYQDQDGEYHDAPNFATNALCEEYYKKIVKENMTPASECHVITYAGSNFTF